MYVHRALLSKKGAEQLWMLTAITSGLSDGPEVQFKLEEERALNAAGLLRRGLSEIAKDNP
jgi:hypothetical protein